MSGAALWARSEIRRGWWSLLMVAALVAIAGGAVTAGVVGARRAGAAVDRYVAESSPSSVVIFSTEPLGDAVTSDIDADPRIAGRSETQLVLATPVGLQPGQQGLTIALPDEWWGDVARPRLIEGRYPVGPDEIAMTESATGGGIAVGDTVEMHMIPAAGVFPCFEGGACQTEPAGEVTVTALLRTDGDLAPGPFSSEAPWIVPAAFVEARGGDRITFATLTNLFLASGVDTATLIADYAPRVDAGDVLESAADTAEAQRAAEIQRDALLIASAIVAVAGLLIAGQAFGRFLTRRPSDSSTLSSLGMTSRQRIVASWMPGLTAATVGALFVVPVAVALSPVFPRGVARRADPDVGFHADIGVLVPGVTVTVAVGAASALVAATLWSRRSTRTASITAVSVVASSARRLHLSPAPTMGSRFALEPGHGGRRAPVIPMLVGAGAAVTILVGALVVTHSLDGLLSTPSRYGATWDLQVSGGDRTIEIGQEIADDDRVDGVALAVSGELGVGASGKDSGSGFAIGMSSIKGSVDPVILDGRAPVGQNEALLGTDTMATLDVQLGDEVVVSGPLGEQTMVVVGRTIVPVLGSQRTNSGVVVPLQTMLDLGGTETVADIDVQPAAFVTVAVGEDIDAVGRDVEAMGAALDGPFRQSGVGVLDEVRVIPLYVASFTALLGALAVFHALVVTSRRRRIDLATMRALGYRPWQAGSVICWQGGVAAAAALAIGVPLGLVGGRFLWQTIADDNNVRIVIDTPWAAIAAVGAIAIVGAGIVLAAWPAWTAGRRHPASDLRAE